MASVAPRSMPAGLSHRIQSNRLLSSPMTRPTPSSVSASLSLVWEAGSSQRFSSRLSRIKACGSLATPCTTLMRSNTTRRSAPITRSRLRRPTSKSTTTTLCPLWASAAPSAAVEVVFPTPPLPEVTTRTLAIRNLLSRLIQRGNFHGVAFQPGLRRAVAKRNVDFFGSLVVAVDRKQLGLDPLAVDPRVGIAVDARHRAAAQRAVDVDRSAGDDLGAGANRAQHGDIAFHEDDRLTRTHRAVEQQRVRLRLGFGLRLLHRLVARDDAGAATGQQGRHVRRKALFLHALDAEDADATLVEAADEMSDGGAREVDGCEVEHDRLADEIARRARQRGVDLGEPFHDRNDGAEYERDIGTAAQPDQLSRGIRSDVHDDRLAFLIERLTISELG